MLALRKYSDPRQFWTEISPHLKREESKNNLLLGLSHTFLTKPEGCLFQFALFTDHELVGAVVGSLFRTNRTLIPAPLKSPEFAKDLFQEIQKSGVEINGIVGELETAKAYESLFIEAGRESRLQMTQGIYRCKKVIPSKNHESLTFRAAQMDDVVQVGQWIENFQREAVPHDPAIIGVDLAKTKIENQMIYLIEKESKPVSMAAWSRDIETSCSVNLVYTPPDFRKKGYGSLVTAKLTQYLLDSGKSETNLYTDISNPTSNKIYQNIGYEFVCDSIHIGISCPEEHKL